MADSSAERKRQPKPFLSPELLKLRELLDRNWVTLREVAHLLGVAYPTVVSYVKDGKLSAVRVGGRYRVYEEPLMEFLRNGGYLQAGDRLDEIKERNSDDSSTPA